MSESSSARVAAEQLALSASTLRAMAREPETSFRGGIPYRGRDRIANLPPSVWAGLRAGPPPRLRGVADAIALRLLYTDEALHSRLRPDGALERLIFDLLELFRVEALVPKGWPGAKRNLTRLHETWSQEVVGAGLTETTQGMAVYAIAEICHARVIGASLTEAAADLIEAPRAAFGQSIAADVAALRGAVEDQERYATHARAIAQTIGQFAIRARGQADVTEEERPDAAQRRAELLSVDDAEQTGGASDAERGSSEILATQQTTYRAFTTAHDRQQAATSLLRSARLDEHRHRLDELRASHPINARLLGRQMISAFSCASDIQWLGGQSDGLIDGSRLVRLITSTSAGDIFRAPHAELQIDAAVTALVDCSGSMKRHSQAVAGLLDLFVRGLDAVGVATEVLGFTTCGWNGAQSGKDWQRAGRPARPGRLNDVSHIVFKEFETPRKLARQGIAGLLEESLYREGVDGEAVEWAATRLARREERRRVLLVLTDGGPSDRATALANEPGYLDNHLRAVAGALEQCNSIEVVGIGVESDVSAFYHRAHTIELSSGQRAEALRTVLEAIGRDPTVHTRPARSRLNSS